MKYIFLITLLILPFGVFAHGSNVIETKSGDYEISLSYDGEVRVHNSQRYNINLLIASSSVPLTVEYDSVWVKLEQGDDIQFISWLYKPKGLLSGFTYTFKEAKSYTLTTKFVKNEKTIAEGILSIPVTNSDAKPPKAPTSPFRDTLFTTLGLLIGFCVGFLAYKVARNKITNLN